MTHLPVQRLRPDAQLPTRAHPADAGLDLYAVDDAVIAPAGHAAIPTGIAVAIPSGYAGLVVPRSGLARKHGVTVTNAPGLIDAGYRGELQVLLSNLGDTAFQVRAGERVAQLVIVPVTTGSVAEVDALPPADDERGSGGFGSTGR